MDESFLIERCGERSYQARTLPLPGNQIKHVMLDEWYWYVYDWVSNRFPYSPNFVLRLAFEDASRTNLFDEIKFRSSLMGYLHLAYESLMAEKFNLSNDNDIFEDIRQEQHQFNKRAYTQATRFSNAIQIFKFLPRALDFETLNRNRNLR